VYPDVFPPTAPYPVWARKILKQDNNLKDRTKTPVNWEDLKGKSVALLFADPTQYKTANLIPMLLQYYRTMNESGDRQKLEIIFIPSVTLKENTELYDQFVRRMPWLHYDGPAHDCDTLIDHYRVSCGLMVVPKYGYPTLTDTPGLVVIDREGAALKKLLVDDLGPGALLKWDFYRDIF